MRLTTVLLIASLIQVSASTFGQKITLSEKNASLKLLFKEIRKQSGFNFYYDGRLITTDLKSSIKVSGVSIEEALNQLLSDLPLAYEIKDRLVIIRKKEFPILYAGTSIWRAPIEVSGRVTNKSYEPLVGATVSVKGQRAVFTDKDGNFKLIGVEETSEISISYVGYTTRTLKPSVRMAVVLEISNSKLDEVQVMAYGTTSRRQATNNITKVSGETINNTPISNPMLALQGRVPGMIVTQSSGVPGSNVTMQIRGRTRVDQISGAGENPLFVIDGVPMAAGGGNINALQSAISGVVTGGGLSPFGTLSPGDIESIEVLKDADATSIYGSRGARGVVLVTTKKGKSGVPSINARFGMGFSKAPDPKLLNNKQYLEMRREAFKNDNKVMTPANAYDLLVWDTTRTTNLAKELIGGTAAFSNAEASISGGTSAVQYVMRSTYSRETNVYPKPLPNTRATVSSNLSGKLFDNRFSFNLTGIYSNNKNQTVNSDLGGKLTLPPHFKLYNEDGTIAWNEGGMKVIDNPLAGLSDTYTAKTHNLNGSIMLGYQVIPNLQVRASLGYNHIITKELRTSPRESKNPLDANIINTAQFGEGNFNSLIFEPYAEYKRAFSKGTLTVMAGGSVQRQADQSYNFGLNNYVSDALLGSMVGLTSNSFTNPGSSDTEYKYTGVYGRATYNYDNTFVLNVSGRRDGSSRFGPNYKFSNFGAVGTSWIFSNLNLFKNQNVLSFGKLRGSYGITGNDQIGDYMYLSLYSVPLLSGPYTDLFAVSPESFFKPDLHWELNKKLEIATELGFLKDRILLSLSWYRDNTSDPLVQYPLPASTGFQSVTANLNSVVVQNRGWEISLSTINIQRENFRWNTNFLLTLPSNRLLKYPGLAETTYANRYVIGKSLDIQRLTTFAGVDPITGLYSVGDLNGSGKYESASDFSFHFDTEPEYYGSFENTFSYKNFAVTAFFTFDKGYRRNWRYAKSSPIGLPVNVPLLVLDRWQYEGQITDIAKYSTNSPASNSLNSYSAAGVSTGSYTNALFVNFQTVNLRYSLPQDFVKTIGMNSASIFLQGQNLSNFVPFSNINPNSLFTSSLRPLRTYLMGIQVSL